MPVSTRKSNFSRRNFPILAGLAYRGRDYFTIRARAAFNPKNTAAPVHSQHSTNTATRALAPFHRQDLSPDAFQVLPSILPRSGNRIGERIRVYIERIKTRGGKRERNHTRAAV
jgi:hypothetical protein